MTHVYAFDHPHDLPMAELTARIGGKAANLAVMAGELGLPVPPGFTISTAACRAYLEHGWPDGLDAEIREHMARVEAAVGRRFGGPGDPLLVSVRSGAPVSMPGMMDTILNLGLNDETVEALAEASGDAAFAADCLRRFRAMFREIVGVDEVPDDPWAQLRLAIEAVFRSWQSDRARAYRAREGIADDLGTAVTVQAMVFGNRGETSATGVLFTRNPATGEAQAYGDVMFNAQGEDVVAGTHATQPIAALEERLPDVAGQLRDIASRLERHHADLCDIEFTVEQGRLWMLQCRVGKRSPQAAVRIAREMADDETFPLTREEAVRRVAALLGDPPTIATGRSSFLVPLTTGLAASPGVASGPVALTPEAAERGASDGRRPILVRSETSPNDVHGMAVSAGILTARGGLASHAAVVARGWGIPAVVGAAAVEVDGEAVTIGGRVLRPGDTITIDGSSGEVFAGAIPDSRVVVPEALVLLEWARALGIEPVRPAAAAPPTAEPSAPDTAPTPEPAAARSPVPALDEVLRMVAIKGFATADALAEALSAPAGRLADLLDQLVLEGHIAPAAGAFRVTDAGKRRAAELLAREQAAWDEPARVAALDDFIALDHRMKQAVTDWQLRGPEGAQVVNDHTDAAYDRAVLDRLTALHADTVGWLTPLVDSCPRLGRYRDRLDRAATAAAAGDGRYVASPRVDSYHGAWFELHEDLIQLAGRTREEEAAAGRA